MTTFEARAWGDEYANGMETVDGYTILQDPDSGYWFYAEVDEDTGQLAATDKVAGQDSPPASARGARPVVIRPQSELEVQAGVGVPSVPTLGLLISFNDRAAVGTTEANWVSNFFGATNSIKAYYNEVSYNGFTLTPAAETCGTSSNDGVTGWMNLGINHPNVGGANLTYAALQAADGCVNYAAFDTNGDKVLLSNELLIIVIVAGYENSYGGAQALTPNVWGHMSGFTTPTPLDGIAGFLYGQFGEWHANNFDNPGHAATIGIMVHETGHLIGWPDLYDTDQSSEGVGDWSVMGSGSWLGTTYSGDTPAHPSAWEKWYQGWLTPVQLQGTNTNYNVPRVEDNKTNSVIQLLDNPNGVDWSFGQTSGTGEYFLVENRQKTGYDAALPGCGLLIWHIDETRTQTNSANADETRKLVDVEEADGLNHLDSKTNRGDAGDPYPGSGNKTTFNDTSTPNSKLYDGSFSGVAVANIGSCASTMMADFTADTMPPKVNKVNSNADTGDGSLDESETTTVAITQLLLTFNEAVQDPTGDTGTHDVTNPANYRLFSDGTDNAFQTTVCGAVQGDDQAIPIDSVIYNSGTQVATLNVNGGTRLPADNYRLLACGSTSIKDVIGNSLDGNGDGTGGDDFTRNFSVDTPPPQVSSVYLPIILKNAGVPSAPTLAPIDNNDGDGNYTISWSNISEATGYVLEEDNDENFTSPITVYSGASTSKTITGRGTGTYYYRVQATNSFGHGPWSNVVSVQVASQPGVVPKPGYWSGSKVSFEVTADSSTVHDFTTEVYVSGCGTYQLSWKDVAISDGQFSGGGVSGKFSTPTSASGSYTYFFQACNGWTLGTGSWSATWRY